MFLGLAQQSSGKDCELPLQGVQVQCLVGELRSSKPCGMAKKKKKVQVLSMFIETSWHIILCGKETLFSCSKPMMFM